MKYFSTFSGIGGFELGIQQAYELHNSKVSRLEKKKKSSNIQKIQPNDKGKHGRQPPTCIGYSEVDKYAIQIYEKHFGDRGITKKCREDDKCESCTNGSNGERWWTHTYNYKIKGHKNYGDITKIKAEELPDFDLFVGGFPCQAFSIARKRGGFGDTRGTLFFEVARIVREKQPRLLLLENVKGLLSHDQGRTFTTIISTLDELGYDLQWQVLNSKNFGVPQNRERVFIVGHLRGTSRPQVFPFGESTGKDIVQLNQPKHSNDRVYGKEGVSPTLNTAQGGNRQPFISDVSQMGREGRPRVYTENSPTISARDYKEPRIVNNIRRLTPTECERLQGFPDGWTEGLSDTQRYKTLGNAVTVNVIKAIMEKLI